MSEQRAGVSRATTVLIVVACLVVAAVGGAYILISSQAPNSSNTGTLGSLSSTTPRIPSSSSSTTITKPETACANVAQYDTSIPSTYQSMYTTLDQILTDYGRTLDSKTPVAAHQVIYATELLPADSNLGSKLLSPQTMQSVVLFLNAIQKLGIQGVTIDISYPILVSSFPNYTQYLSFYQNVVEMVRQRGMKIDIESETPLLVGYPGLSLGSVSYANLPYNTYVTEDREMIQTVINDLHPDYLNIGTETDTLQNVLHYPEISTPQGWASYISSILAGLNKGTTKINVGIGSWDPISYLDATLNNSAIDAIDVHIYPVYGDYLTVLTQIGELSTQYHKPIVIDEMWLHKSVMNEGVGFATDAKISARNDYSFWVPLDEEFLKLMAKYAQVYNVAFISPFEATIFFAYLNYSPSTANLPNDGRQEVSQAAGQNIAENLISPLGCYYQNLIRGQISLSAAAYSVPGQEPERPSQIEQFLVVCRSCGASN